MADDDLDVEMRFHVNATELDRIRGAQDAVRRLNGETAKGAKETAEHTKRATNEMKSMGTGGAAGIKAAAMQMAGLAGGITGAIGSLTMVKRQFDEASRAAAEYQNSMLEVSTLSDMNKSSMVALSANLQDLAVRFGQVDTVMAKAQYDVMSAGFSDIGDSMYILEAASKSAIGGVSNVATSAKLLTQIINAYGGSAEDAAGISDQLFATVKNGVTTFEELAANLGKVTGTAATAKIRLSEILAAIAVMTKRGINTAESVTALNGLILAIGAATGESKGKLDELGVTLDGGLAPALAAVNGAAAGNLAVLRELIPEMAALKGAATAGAGGAAELTAQILKIESAAKAGEEAFQKMSGGAELAGKRLEAAEGRLKQAFGGTLLNERAAVTNARAESINGLATSIENLSASMSPFRDMTMDFTLPEQMSNFDSAPFILGLQDSAFYADKLQTRLAAVAAQVKNFTVAAPTEPIKELSKAEQEAAEKAARLAAEFRALAPVAQGLGLKVTELKVDMSGKIAWVNRTPDELARDISDTVQYAYESSQKPMIIAPKVQVEMQGPLLGMSPEEIADTMRKFQDAGARAMSVTEQGAVSLATAIQGSLVNAIYDAKAKLIDLGSIGRSAFSSIIGGLAALGIGALATAINPGLGVIVRAGLGLSAKRALGGATSGPSIVGEYGPELFLPDRPGLIVPSDKLRNMRGGGNTTIDARTTVNLPASSVIFLNSRSAIRRLAEETSRLQEEKISRTYSGGRR